MPSPKKVVLFLVALSILAFLQGIRILSSVVDNSSSMTTNTHGTEEALHSFKHPTTTTTIKDKNTIQKFDSSQSLFAANRLVHRTIFGLGHRLCRMTAAWHLAKTLNLTSIQFDWQTCGKDPAVGPDQIFPYLFGSDIWPVVPTTTSSSSIMSSTQQAQQEQYQGKKIVARNDVYGYVPGQAYKNHRLPLDRNVYQHNSNSSSGSGSNSHSPFLEKLRSDVQLYELLSDRFGFQHKRVVLDFMEEHRFQDHTVLGLHLRAGNGEQTHFVASGRYLANETEFVENLIKLLHTFVKVQTTTNSSSKPPLLFLATDTVSLVPGIVQATQQLFHVKTVVLPQIRVSENEGVTFKALQGAGHKCLVGWQAMMSDMLLLSHADVLIAARHSSFTQSLPMSLVLDRNQYVEGPHFCEVSDAGTSMTCLQDLSTWLFRDDPSKMFHYSTKTTTTTTTPTTTNNNNEEEQQPMVMHKMVIHLPDMKPTKEYAQVVPFLQSAKMTNQTFIYGKNRFNPRYRKQKYDGLNPFFTFAEESVSQSVSPIINWTQP